MNEQIYSYSCKLVNDKKDTAKKVEESPNTRKRRCTTVVTKQPPE